MSPFPGELGTGNKGYGTGAAMVPSPPTHFPPPKNIKQAERNAGTLTGMGFLLGVMKMFWN